MTVCTKSCTDRGSRQRVLVASHAAPLDVPETAVAITEPQAGSDAAGMTTTASKVDGGYLL
ncbi:MAG: hypothetical protein GEU93_19175 [Propionibacteriales bacterium]|nr:hypothetical protein [Propionibacteriales bacterium]